jgi:single-strand DNA-binding protein
MDVNKVMLLGRLGANPVLRSTQNGVAVASFSVATVRRFKKEGALEEAWNEEIQWHKVVVWGKQAENCAKYLTKGQTVFLEGGIRMRKYLDQKGDEKLSFEIHAEKLSYLGRPKGKNTEEQAWDEVSTEAAPETLEASA